MSGRLAWPPPNQRGGHGRSAAPVLLRSSTSTAGTISSGRASMSWCSSSRGALTTLSAGRHARRPAARARGRWMRNPLTTAAGLRRRHRGVEPNVVRNAGAGWGRGGWCGRGWGRMCLVGVDVGGAWGSHNPSVAGSSPARPTRGPVTCAFAYRRRNPGGAEQRTPIEVRLGAAGAWPRAAPPRTRPASGYGVPGDQDLRGAWVAGQRVHRQEPRQLGDLAADVVGGGAHRGVDARPCTSGWPGVPAAVGQPTENTRAPAAHGTMPEARRGSRPASAASHGRALRGLITDPRSAGR
jgi:hypothetical protein